MAWERSFEARVHKIREKELKYQKLSYNIEVSMLSTVCSFVRLVCVLPGRVQRDLQRISNSGYVDIILALYSDSRSNIDPFYCLHIRESFICFLSRCGLMFMIQ